MTLQKYKITNIDSDNGDLKVIFTYETGTSTQTLHYDGIMDIQDDNDVKDKLEDYAKAYARGKEQEAAEIAAQAPAADVTAMINHDQIVN